MNEIAVAHEPRIKHKTFTYRSGLHWVGGRAAVLAADGKPEFRAASPPEFKGETGVWTPEDLLVAAVNLCTMTTFCAFAQRLEIPIVSYTSEAEGRMEFVDGGYRITQVTLRPTILVGEADARERAEKAIVHAHETCIISNSIRARVVLEPTVAWMGPRGTPAG